MAGRMRLGHLGNMPHARMQVIERDREQAVGICMRTLVHFGVVRDLDVFVETLARGHTA